MRYQPYLAGAVTTLIFTACASDTATSPQATPPAALSAAVVNKDVAVAAGNTVMSDLDAFAYKRCLRRSLVEQVGPVGRTALRGSAHAIRQIQVPIPSRNSDIDDSSHTTVGPKDSMPGRGHHRHRPR